ncbi:MAG: MmgE/PrpD family protein [Acidimicrobiales bacterium]
MTVAAGAPAAIGRPDAAAAAVDRGPVVAALEDLGAFAAGVEWSEQPEAVRTAALRVLGDSVAVTIAGGRLAENRRIRGALPASPGPATVFGEASGRGVVDAAWCNGTAMVSLELDEGNKAIRGHAAAHVLPAVLAVGEAQRVPGQALAAAFLAGHEVASRLGRATVLRPGVHPHGNWGVAGAAAGAARLAGADARRMARALDVAGALALATPFSVATSGLSVRHAWIGAANASGIRAAALSTLDEPVAGVAGDSLGCILGTLDPAALVDALGTQWAVTGGYFKRHASCSYTHPPADAALAVRSRRGPVTAGRVTAIEVATHHLAASLDGMRWDTRLAAMFSVPYVVAVALRHGDCAPERFDDAHRADADLRSLAGKVSVVLDPALDARLPAWRAARLRVGWADGSEDVVEMDNPVGDADHHPFSDGELLAKWSALLGQDRAAEVSDACSALVGSADVSVELGALRHLAAAP